NGLDATGHRRFLQRLSSLDAEPWSAGGGRVRRRKTPGPDGYLLALLRMDGRYAHHRPTGIRGRARSERATLAALAGDERRLYQLTARLWRFVDLAARTIGIGSPDDLQDIADEFRRARGLLDGKAAREWLEANDLDDRKFADLVAADA